MDEVALEPLAHTVNPYGGVVVAPQQLPEDPQAFALRLAQSLPRWREEGLAFVWLELPTRLARLVPEATERGFFFHHTGPDYLMLGYKLEPKADTLGFATHYVGAGGVVLREDRQLLVVRERLRRADQPQPYKLPGGYLEPGEHLAAAIEREVWEETGVRTRFESVVCFRHWHAGRFGKSDFYFVCRLEPLSLEITRQESEIAEAKWMPVEEFLQRDDVHAFNKGVVRQALLGPGMTSGWFEGYEASRAEREIFLRASR